MAVGSPDWQGLRWKIETTRRPDLIYSSGKIGMLEEFENPPLKWFVQTAQSGAITLSTEQAFTGTSSLKITTNATLDSYGGITRRIGLLESKKIGLEARFTPPDSTDHYIEFMVQRFDGTNKAQSIVRWNDNGDKWQYSDSAGAWTDITNGAQDFFRGTTSWQHMKVVVDFNTNKYVSLMANELFLDLSAISMNVTADTTAPYIELFLRLRNISAEADEIFIDNIVLTEE